MNSLFKQHRIVLTLLVSMYIVTTLTWQYLTSGVPAHHLFADPSLPKISNWWGLAILPLYSWVLTSLITKQYGAHFPKKIWLQFSAAGLYALIITVLFYTGHQNLVAMLAVPTILIAALFFPVYQAAFLLGYVVVSSYGFGAFLPAVFGLVFAAMAWVVHKLVRLVARYLFKARVCK
ncbi:hypothetical protein ORJ66_18780 [Pseudoalteromonas tunicata]|uniref:hypothetical protein n=1 Tax=Pseudoalteromonas tunicata TaxID=314281 RepID=UPI00273D040A|nr:hypothetical protein [Pseudoalteromonas tunicata]MDP5215103.1 hypothetical protein [Pseudoalteromonas tunicata]